MREQMIAALFAHFIGDFILQTDAMAKNKSKSLWWLSVHCTVYGLPLLFFGWKFALANIGLHLCTDFVSSKITSRLLAAGKTHWFFVVIGLDQFIHATCLIATLTQP